MCEGFIIQEGPLKDFPENFEAKVMCLQRGASEISNRRYCMRQSAYLTLSQPLVNLQYHGWSLEHQEPRVVLASTSVAQTRQHSKKRLVTKGTLTFHQQATTEELLGAAVKPNPLPMFGSGWPLISAETLWSRPCNNHPPTAGRSILCNSGIFVPRD